MDDIQYQNQEEKKNENKETAYKRKMEFSEPFSHIFASGGLNVYEQLLKFEDFMFFHDELMPQSEVQKLKLMDTS